MASSPTLDLADHELRITRLESDAETILCNQGKIIEAIKHVAMKEDLDRLEAKVDKLEAKVDKLLKHFGLSVE